MLALALLLPACSGAPKAEGPSASASPSSTPTPDPRPTPASSNGPARNVPRPVLPEAAKQNTKEGFAAFTQYWFDTVTYGLETGDSGPLREISLPDCKMCASWITSSNNVSRTGQWQIAPRWNASSFVSDMTPDSEGRIVGNFTLEESESKTYSSAGVVIEENRGGRLTGIQSIYAERSNESWVTAEAGTP
ncbi:DUF6318 family protein [Sinomonas terricola]|uniref:DUF6318 family protein n=1 Tax=Sinomonas terricola TaxID=3110330 RepID=UPI003D17C5F7